MRSTSAAVETVMAPGKYVSEDQSQGLPRRRIRAIPPARGGSLNGCGSRIAHDRVPREREGSVAFIVFQSEFGSRSVLQRQPVGLSRAN